MNRTGNNGSEKALRGLFFDGIFQVSPPDWGMECVFRPLRVGYVPSGCVRICRIVPGDRQRQPGDP